MTAVDEKELAANNPEQAAHNLEHQGEDDSAALSEQSPRREPGAADFGAEAHGFTGYEAAGKGSDYRGGGASNDGWWAKIRGWFGG